MWRNGRLLVRTYDASKTGDADGHVLWALFGVCRLKLRRARRLGSLAGRGLGILAGFSKEVSAAFLRKNSLRMKAMVRCLERLRKL